MYCKNCGIELKSGEIFCKNCGIKIDNKGADSSDQDNSGKSGFGLICPHCNEKIKFSKKASKKFCPNCGKSIDYEELLKDARNRRKPTNVAKSAKKAIIEAIDENGNGEIDIEDIIIKGMNTPGIRIKRAEYFQKTFSNTFSADIISKAIESNPVKAGIEIDEIDKMADAAIKFERNFVSGISAALGAPGGIAMVATIPADLVQYYAYMLRAAQKLLYLYGFPEIDLHSEGGNLDDATMNTLILCMGVMYGVAGANNAIKAMAKALATGVEKQLMKKALTKGTIYPIVKSISKWFGIKMTKEVFAGFFKHSIPVVGGIIGGGLTFVSFKPCCDRLKNTLKNTKLVDEKLGDDIIDITSDEIIDVTEEDYRYAEDDLEEEALLGMDESLTGTVDGIAEDEQTEGSDAEELYCTRCNAILTFQEGFDPKLPVWKCKACGQVLTNPGFEADKTTRFNNVQWFCDKCGDHLNSQEGFSDWCEEWVCEKCGWENKIGEEEIED